MPRNGFTLRNFFSIFNLFGVTRDDAVVTGVSLASADTLETRTQGGRIAELFGRLRTQDHAVLATTRGMVVRAGAFLGTTFVLVVVVLVAVALALFAAPASAAEEFEKYGLESVSASLSSLQVGAQADFGFKDLDVSFVNEEGGSHPFALATEVVVETVAI